LSRASRRPPRLALVGRREDRSRGGQADRGARLFRHGPLSPGARMKGTVSMRSPFVVAALALALTSCQTPQAAEQAEIARNTFACMVSGERVLIRFVDRSEVRV